MALLNLVPLLPLLLPLLTFGIRQQPRGQISQRMLVVFFAQSEQEHALPDSKHGRYLVPRPTASKRSVSSLLKPSELSPWLLLTLVLLLQFVTTNRRWDGPTLPLLLRVSNASSFSSPEAFDARTAVQNLRYLLHSLRV